MASVTRTTCDICGKLLLPTSKDEMPWDLKTHFESVKITYEYNGKETPWDVCPRCLRRMKRYLKKHGSEFDKVGDPDD